MIVCELCGGVMVRRGSYRALDDAGQAVRDFPADECVKCGHVRPDTEAVRGMRPSHVPSSIRMRCVAEVSVDDGPAWADRAAVEPPRAFDEPRGSRASSSREGSAPRTVLVVDDDVAMLGALERVLVAVGYRVSLASDGAAALEAILSRPFDVVVCDVFMPGMSGLSLLRTVRAHDLDLPVILLTGQPTLDSAMEAVGLGAAQYLEKSLDTSSLVKSVDRACHIHQLTKVKREALDLLRSTATQAEGLAGLGATLDRALRTLWLAFQPIVDLGDRRVFGYEALLRCDEPLMRSPADVLDAAERLGRIHELGRAIRARAAEEAEAADVPLLFVNLHSADLNDADLYSPEAPLSKLASRVVLEVTERASLDEVSNVAGCIARLKALGFRIAIDDLGAGYAGLTSFTQLDPYIAKLDMSLVRGVDADPRRQSIIRSMKHLCDDLGMVVIAEGVETVAERDMLGELGCNLLQGYLFAKPSRTFDAGTW